MAVSSDQLVDQASSWVGFGEDLRQWGVTVTHERFRGLEFDTSNLPGPHSGGYVSNSIGQMMNSPDTTSLLDPTPNE